MIVQQAGEHGIILPAVTLQADDRLEDHPEAIFLQCVLNQFVLF